MLHLVVTGITGQPRGKDAERRYIVPLGTRTHEAVLECFSWKVRIEYGTEGCGAVNTTPRTLTQEKITTISEVCRVDRGCGLVADKQEKDSSSLPCTVSVIHIGRVTAGAGANQI